jgi:hypothetical protein
MKEYKVARALGWFSLGLGCSEVIAGRTLGRCLGMEKRAGLLRVFGLREIAAGIGLLSGRHPAPWLWARVGGDILDLGTLLSALTPDNPRWRNLQAALAAVAAVTLVDVVCAQQCSDR